MGAVGAYRNRIKGMCHGAGWIADGNPDPFCPIVNAHNAHGLHHIKDMGGRFFCNKGREAGLSIPVKFPYFDLEGRTLPRGFAEKGNGKGDILGR